MDIKAMTTLLQIQALQTLGSTQSNPLQTNNTSLFSSMIEEMMQSYSQNKDRKSVV